MHDLICNTLRDINFNRRDSDSIESCVYEVAVALHNLPHELRTTGRIPLATCLSLNELDESSKENEWGIWVQTALATLNQELKHPKS